MDDLDRMRLELLRGFWPQYDPLIRTMTADKIVVASQLALVSALVGVETGSVISPHLFLPSRYPSLA